MILKAGRPFEACDYIILDNRKYLYLNDDLPISAYNSNHQYHKGVCFVAQPMRNKKATTRVVTIPLMMSDEWNILEANPGVLSEIRSTRKEYDYNFVGQCGYQGRDKLKTLNINKYDFESTNPIWDQPREHKHQLLVAFWRRIAKSKFVFAPRGDGSCSFRAYQSMAVGSVPIIMDMVSYPFDDEVDWNALCIRGSLSNIAELIHKANSMTQAEYALMRSNAIDFWDRYCRHDRLHKKISDLVDASDE